MAVKPRRRAASKPRPAERVAQKRRTRKAIVDATIGLLARGITPSLNDVVEAADVSRRTIYLYFPSFDQLLLDATAGALTQGTIDRALAAGPPGENLEARVERLVRAMQQVTPDIERLGRALIRLTVDHDPSAGPAGTPRRGYRRVEWIETALSPWRDRLDPDAWHRLVCGLAMIVGFEALVVQRDVCGLSVDEGTELSVWAARALVKATVA
jgi:AcrR family transcriptional regulator